MGSLKGMAIEGLCHLLVEELPAPLLVHDEQDFVYANQAARVLLRARSAEEIVGKPVLDFIDPGTHDAARERMRLVHENGVHFPQVDNRVIACDGTALHATTRGFPLDFGTTRLVGVLVTDWFEI
ncbi:MAG: hypothetical protein Kow0067_01080 [Coriobacteriia bacterium]